MTVPDAYPGSDVQSGVDGLKPTTGLEMRPGDAGASNSAGTSADTIETTVATWRQMITRYFQDNRRPIDHRDCSKTGII